MNAQSLAKSWVWDHNSIRVRCHMKDAFILGLVLLVSAGARATTVNEADYTSQYEVINTSAVGSFMIGNFCTMGVRDQANPALGLILQRKGYRKCHVWDAGTVLHGRREKNEVRILTRDDKGKLKIESWPVVGTVALPTLPKTH
jgi:hypothetical protein